MPLEYLQTITFYFVSTSKGWVAVPSVQIQAPTLTYKTSPIAICTGETNSFFPGVLYFLGIINPTWKVLDGASLNAITFVGYGTIGLTSTTVLPANSWGTKDTISYQGNASLFQLRNEISYRCLPPPASGLGASVTMEFILPDGSSITLEGYVTNQQNQVLGITLVTPLADPYGPIYGNYQPYNLTSYGETLMRVTLCPGSVEYSLTVSSSGTPPVFMARITVFFWTVMKRLAGMVVITTFSVRSIGQQFMMVLVGYTGKYVLRRYFTDWVVLAGL